tara:strand:+ start:193 stop:483 length:291 start_codon:yes stop_codon:yes gene_type:complete
MLIPSVSPSKSIIDIETEHLLLCFCTYCTLLKGKKLSLQNVFVLVLKEERLRNILKDLLSVNQNFELVKCFLQFEPSIAQSKYITKYLNANKNLKL